jgi:Tat protein secretion system quality control protein TatD with DNase activity
MHATLTAPKTPNPKPQTLNQDERLLLESDLEDCKNVPSALNDMLKTMSNAKGWSMDQAAEMTSANARSFYASRA